MPPLRPLERRILVLRSQGKSFEDMAPMFRRSPAHLERCENMIDLKIKAAKK